MDRARTPAAGKEFPPSLEPVVMVALEAGRMLMEAGASASNVRVITEKFARGLGAERVDSRIGYASLEVNIVVGQNGITRMRRVGALGVNQQVEEALWALTRRVARRELTPPQAREALHRIAADTPRHSPLVMAVAVGVACAAFGRLLGVDWPGTGPVLVAAAIGQYVRRELLARHVNVFIGATLVAFLSSLLGGLGARLAGSATETTAMIASVLLLVPGVPAMNAQSDILEGHPTLGSARAVSVGMVLIFVTAGLWFGQMAMTWLQPLCP